MHQRTAGVTGAKSKWQVARAKERSRLGYAHLAGQVEEFGFYLKSER